MPLQVPLEIEQLTRLVALKTSKTPDDILKEAIEARAEAAGIAVPPRRKFDEAKVMAIIEHVSALPILDERSPDEIIGYNETGVPE